MAGNSTSVKNQTPYLGDHYLLHAGLNVPDVYIPAGPAEIRNILLEMLGSVFNKTEAVLPGLVPSRIQLSGVHFPLHPD